MREGIRRLGSERALYLRPMLWSREGSPALIDALPELDRAGDLPRGSAAARAGARWR